MAVDAVLERLMEAAGARTLPEYACTVLTQRLKTHNVPALAMVLGQTPDLHSALELLGVGEFTLGAVGAQDLRQYLTGLVHGVARSDLAVRLRTAAGGDMEAEMGLATLLMAFGCGAWHAGALGPLAQRELAVLFPTAESERAAHLARLRMVTEGPACACAWALDAEAEAVAAAAQVAGDGSLSEAEAESDAETGPADEDDVKYAVSLALAGMGWPRSGTVSRKL